MEQKRNPQWKPNQIPLGGSTRIILRSPGPVWEGTTKFGNCEMWVAEVNNATVIEGRGKDQTTVENYSGEAIFFPSPKLGEKLRGVTGGTQRDIEVEITKTVKEGKSGSPYTEYELSVIGKVSSKETPKKEVEDDVFGESSALSETEEKFVNDVKGLLSAGKNLSDGQIITGGKSSKYNLSEEKIKELITTQIRK